LAEPIRFYFDQHMWFSVAQGLRRNGIDVLTAQEAARCGLSDPDHLAFAAVEERVIVTFDTDFLALHQVGVPHAGIAWCPEQKHSIGDLIKALLLVHGVLDRDSMRQQGQEKRTTGPCLRCLIAQDAQFSTVIPEIADRSPSFDTTIQLAMAPI
jgi:hypothetical protein